MAVLNPQVQCGTYDWTLHLVAHAKFAFLRPECNFNRAVLLGCVLVLALSSAAAAAAAALARQEVLKAAPAMGVEDAQNDKLVHEYP